VSVCVCVYVCVYVHMYMYMYMGVYGGNPLLNRALRVLKSEALKAFGASQTGCDLLY
jgi:hypothetical protein